MSKDEADLQADGIEMRFGGVTALRGIDLGIRSHRWRGLIGPNGSGKSTLLNVLSGVYRPQIGSVFLNGVDITRTTPRHRAKLGIARTFQHPQLAQSLTVRENVLIGARLGHASRSESRRQESLRADAALDSLSCVSYAAALPNEIPYGARKLVELARAIAAKPSVVLLDEPAAGLSAIERIELAKALTEFRATDPNTSFCLVEHDVSLVRMLCDELLVLDAGEQIGEGATDVVLDEPRVRAAYLGSVDGSTEKES